MIENPLTARSLYDMFIINCTRASQPILQTADPFMTALSQNKHNAKRHLSIGQQEKEKFLHGQNAA